MTVYDLAYLFVSTIDARFMRGLHLRDRDGAALTTLDQLLAAIAAGRWPNE